MKVTRERATSEFTPIVGDGAIAGPDADGRMLPVLIIDTTSKPQLAELIRVHRFFNSGDVRSIWGRPEKSTTHVLLKLDFLAPIQAEVVLLFDVERQSGLVDQIVTARGLYLQSGVVGDLVSTTIDRPKVLVEVGVDDFRSIWEETLRRTLHRQLRRDHGADRKQAEQVAEEVIQNFRKFGSFRFPRSEPTATDVADT